MKSVICLIFWNLSRGIGKRREKSYDWNRRYDFSRNYQAIAKTLDELYYCTEERSANEIKQHFKNLRDTSYVWDTRIYNSQLVIDADELPVMYGVPTSKLSFRCKLDVTRSGYYVLDKIREISLFVGRIVNSMMTLYRGN